MPELRVVAGEPSTDQPVRASEELALATSNFGAKNNLVSAATALGALGGGLVTYVAMAASAPLGAPHIQTPAHDPQITLLAQKVDALSLQLNGMGVKTDTIMGDVKANGKAIAGVQGAVDHLRADCAHTEDTGLRSWWHGQNKTGCVLGGPSGTGN